MNPEYLREYMSLCSMLNEIERMKVILEAINKTQPVGSTESLWEEVTNSIHDLTELISKIKEKIILIEKT